MFYHNSDRFNSGMFFGALLGGAITTVAVALLNTKQGRKIQREAVNQFHELEDVAEKYVKKAVKAEHSVEKAVKKAKPKIIRKAKSAAKKVKKAVEGSSSSNQPHRAAAHAAKHQ